MRIRRKPTEIGELAYYYYQKRKYSKAINYAKSHIDFSSLVESVAIDSCQYIDLICSSYLKLNKLDLLEYNAKILLNSTHLTRKEREVFGVQSVYYQARAYYFLGIVYSTQNNHSDALKSARMAVSLFPDDPIYRELLNTAMAHHYYLQGKDHVEKDEADQAILKFSEAIALQEKPYFYRARANAYKDSNRLVEALVDVNKLIHLEPVHHHYYLRALIKLGLNECMLAHLDLCTAIRLCEDQQMLPTLYHTRAWALQGLDLLEEAIAQEEKAIELNLNLVEPDNMSESYYLIGYCNFQRYKINEAVTAILKAIALDPQIGKYYFKLACAYDLLGEQEKAISNFSKAIEIDPTRSRYYEKRGQSYYKLKQYNDAKLDVTNAIALDPSNQKSYSFLQKIYKKLGHTEMVRDVTLQRVHHHPLTLFRHNNRIYISQALEETQDDVASRSFLSTANNS